MDHGSTKLKLMELGSKSMNLRHESLGNFQFRLAEDWARDAPNNHDRLGLDKSGLFVQFVTHGRIRRWSGPRSRDRFRDCLQAHLAASGNSGPESFHRPTGRSLSSIFPLDGWNQVHFLWTKNHKTLISTIADDSSLLPEIGMRFSSPVVVT